MGRLYIRLDDACPRMDVEKWNRIECLLDKYQIKPLVGIIPDCTDPYMDKYNEDYTFWSQRIPSWKSKGWSFALHGLNHVYHTTDGGLNPVNRKSEYAGVPLEEQRAMIRTGVDLLKQHDITVDTFFAPAHTFDRNTLYALEMESEIRFISDTPAIDCYQRYNFTFVPQQSGRVRKLPFKTITYCYHPNFMKDSDFETLETFIANNEISNWELIHTDRKLSIIDLFVMQLYYLKHGLGIINRIFRH